MGKALYLNYLKKINYLREPTGSQLPSAQNNLHAKVAHFGERCSEPLLFFVLISMLDYIEVAIKLSKISLLFRKKDIKERRNC